MTHEQFENAAQYWNKKEQVKMLKNHAHFLSEAVDVQFYFLSGSIDIFFLCDIYTIKNDLTVCRLFKEVQTSEKSRFTGSGRSDDGYDFALADADGDILQHGQVLK